MHRQMEKKRGVETAIYEIIDTLVDSYQKIIYLYVEQIKYQAILKEIVALLNLIKKYKIILPP